MLFGFDIILHARWHNFTLHAIVSIMKIKNSQTIHSRVVDPNVTGVNVTFYLMAKVSLKRSINVTHKSIETADWTLDRSSVKFSYLGYILSMSIEIYTAPALYQYDRTGQPSQVIIDSMHSPKTSESRVFMG